MAENNSITIKIPPETLKHVEQAIANANRRLTGPTAGFCSHGPLTLQSLVEMLLEAVAQTQSRPGGREADSMSELLLREGYDVTGGEWE